MSLFDTFGYLSPKDVAFLDIVQKVVHNNFLTPENQSLFLLELGLPFRKGLWRNFLPVYVIF
ncbi:hypothetical protein HanRHA438_Chr10g0467891 [Helianthus annuus]|nr:hypothetical protein HanRHA438_Chr10g0467891 [Helianthus annuus]